MTPPLLLLWRITERCDLACPFCAYDRRRRWARAEADVDEARRFGRVLGGYARQTGRPVLVSFLGGEPLRWPPLFALAREFREAGLQVGATTNGTALRSAEVRRQVAETFNQLTVSVDAAGPLHDALRGAPGLFDRLAADLRELRALRERLGRGPQLRANTVLMRDTVRGFEAVCEAAADWGVEVLTFNALGGRDRPEFFPAHALRPEDLAWLRAALPGLRERCAARGLTLLGADAYVDRLARAADGAPRPVDDCGPGQSFLFVDERGRVGACSFTVADAGLGLADLRSAEDLAALPQRLAARIRTRRPAACADCPSTQVAGKFASGHAPDVEKET